MKIQTHDVKKINIESKPLISDDEGNVTTWCTDIRIKSDRYSDITFNLFSDDVQPIINIKGIIPILKAEKKEEVINE